MKRILDSSKTLTHQLVRSNSKSRRPFSRDVISNVEKHKLRNSVMSNVKSHASFVSLARQDFDMDLEVSRHNMPEKLNWYWNLNEDHKRKITNPSYVRQAVQDTFMQRAQGGYHYKKSGSLRNSFSTKAPGNHRQPEVSTRSKAKAAKPPALPPPDKVVPKLQVPKRKRIIDTAKPVQNYLKSGAKLKESGQKQLEEAKKKLYDPAPAVLDYLIDKHVPKMSGHQVREKMEKSAVGPQLPPFSSSLMQRVFGWKGKDELKKHDSGLSITPRSIEVRKTSARPPDVGGDGGKIKKKRNVRKPRISLRGSAKNEAETGKKHKKPAEDPEEKCVQKIQANKDREAIWNKMKARTTQEEDSVKKQVRDFELSPQIYPKGSLSVRKSHLPITACRPRVDVRRPAESLATVYAVKQQEAATSPSITNHILDSLKNIFSKMRRNSA